MTADAWWAVALSEAVNGDKPLAVVCEGEELVLFRNAVGEAFALEDRCPHRRVPLSPGRIERDGLQCPYHGWTFDGATGKCTDIPNLRRDEHIPARHSAIAFPVAESNGFVHVSLSEGALIAAPPSSSYVAEGREFTGSAVVSLARDRYVDAMLDGPECLLEFHGVQITDFFLGDPRHEDGRLVLDRGAVWKGQWLAPAFVKDHPLIVRTSASIAGGAIDVELLTDEEEPLVTVAIACTANKRGTTSLCWRGFVHETRVRGAPLRWRATRLVGRPPCKLFTAVDGAAVARLYRAASRDLAIARAKGTVTRVAEDRSEGRRAR